MKYLIAFFSIFSVVHAQAQSQLPTLDQTMAYLKYKIEEYGEFDHVVDDDIQYSKLFFPIDSVNKRCHIYIREDVHTKPVGKVKFSFSESWKYMIDLRHLDEKKLDVYGEDGFVSPVTLTLRCNGSNRNITRINSNGKANYDFMKVLKFRAVVKDVDRIKNAFAHGIKACKAMDVDIFDQ